MLALARLVNQLLVELYFLLVQSQGILRFINLSVQGFQDFLALRESLVNFFVKELLDGFEQLGDVGYLRQDYIFIRKKVFDYLI